MFTKYALHNGLFFGRLFSYVNESLLLLKTYSSFIDLLDNYEKTQGINENIESEELDEQNAFLDALMDTAIGARLYEFFLTNGKWLPRHEILTQNQSLKMRETAAYLI